MVRPGQTRAKVKSAFEAAFTRAQLEWALWRLEHANAKRKPSSVFKVRVKHLLEFDRSEPLKNGYANWAFSDEAAGGRGEHSLFSAYDVTLLEVGLGLLDIGFKRKEVVLLLRNRRNELRYGFGPKLEGALKLATKGVIVSDAELVAPANKNRLMLLLPRVEPDTNRGVRSLRHVLCTPQKIGDALREAAYDRLIVVDVTYCCHRLPALLLQAPTARRGRSGT